jgi:acetoin utilization deacetylase AcuC-like enzyme
MAATYLYTSERFRDHETGAHPERPLRLEKIEQMLTKQGLRERCVLPEWKPVSLERLQRNHAAKYIEEVAEFMKQGRGRIESDTVVSEKSYDVALLAAGAVCDAVTQVVHKRARNALCLVRPPGHHALAKRAMGFCLFNNIAVGAHLAVSELKLNRVLIIDWDVHHGNGTQDAFWEDSRVGFFSIHRYPFYPGSGAADETGAGEGLGFTRNVPIKYGTSREAYHAAFEKELIDFAEKVRPELILISAGFDAHKEDPIGSLGLETEDFSRMSQTVKKLAQTHCGSKIVSVLEGGYHVDRLADCVQVHLETLLAP